MNNINVLVEAKKEYTDQMTMVLCPTMINTFNTMYDDTCTSSKGKRVLISFQQVLQEVPNWNNHMVAEHTKQICDSCAWFSDLLAAVFVSSVKILSSIRLNSQSKKISVKLPTNDVFIHGCYISVAKDLYKNPYVFYEYENDNERYELLTKRISNCIELTVKEMIPVQEILKTYISQDGNKVEFNNNDLDDEDPELEETETFGETEEAEEVEEIEETGETGETAETGEVEETEGTTDADENKDITLGKVSTEYPEEAILFNDAPEHKQKH